ncbi:MAG: hypothetical protein KIT89_04975 [Microcella sp.]|uniref:TetR/AcrR family transcriptional regulator n=1 Tax=Microcella sp. TaxID=1913979 RepID=UPI0024C6BFE0|nr:hypothetical protein [Microcella sp.]UYN84536.1 MAG: hypothetical protein KIT89_04975 [Microcella sp.]
MSPPRAYTLGRRATSAAATREAIIGAALQQLADRPMSDFTLERVATLADCSVRTVIRHVGGRDRAIDLALERLLTDAESHPPEAWESVDEALDSIVQHYAQWGGLVSRLLEQEHIEPRLAGITRMGRDMHRAEARRIVELATGESEPNDALIDLVAIATDVSAWQLLVDVYRRSPHDAARSMRRMALAVIAHREGTP